MDSVTRRSPMPVPVETLWTWHTRPGAIERLMPPWDPVRVVARTGGIENGTRVTLAVPFGPLRLRWVSEHRDVDPPHGFVDSRSPARSRAGSMSTRWTPTARRRRRFEDRIEYAGPAGPLGRAVARRAVGARLPSLLRYRHETLSADLAAHARVDDRPRLTVGITGASGLVGTALTALPDQRRASRRPLRARDGRLPARRVFRDSPDVVAWDPQRGFPSPDRVPRSTP